MHDDKKPTKDAAFGEFSDSLKKDPLFAAMAAARKQLDDAKKSPKQVEGDKAMDRFIADLGAHKPIAMQHNRHDDKSAYRMLLIYAACSLLGLVIAIVFKVPFKPITTPSGHKPGAEVEQKQQELIELKRKLKIK